MSVWENKVKYNCRLNLEDSHAQTGDVHETVLDFEMKGLTEHRAGFWLDGGRFFHFYNLKWMAINAIMFMMRFILVGKGWITLELYSHWFVLWGSGHFFTWGNGIFWVNFFKPRYQVQKYLCVHIEWDSHVCVRLAVNIVVWRPKIRILMKWNWITLFSRPEVLRFQHVYCKSGYGWVVADREEQLRALVSQRVPRNIS